jgi:Fe2+ or Zn2+ uptake regulation protein
MKCNDNHNDKNNLNRRMTKQKRVIFEELKKLKTHPTAEELYYLVKKVIPNVSLGTVYRNLELLSQSGNIMKLESSSSHSRFDPNAEEHYHIKCMRCNKVTDAPEFELDDINIRVEQESGYKIIGRRLDFMGICPECLKR